MTHRTVAVLFAMCACSSSRSQPSEADGDGGKSATPDSDSADVTLLEDSGLAIADGSALTHDAEMDSAIVAIPDAAISTEAEVFSAQVFREIEDIDLMADIYVPEGEGPFPAVLVIHGGGFTQGARDGMAEIAWSTALQSAGFVAMSVDYRVNSQFGNRSPNYPGPLEDLKCAVRWLRHHAARYRVDPNHVFSLGGSAGGHHSSMLGVTGGEDDFDTTCLDGASVESDTLQGTVEYYGPVDWAALATHRETGVGRGEATYVGSSCESEPDISTTCLEASVRGHLDAADPPFFVAHSDDDPVVPVEQSRLMRQMLEENGTPVEYREITGQGHGWHAAFRNAEIAGIRDEILEWLRVLSAR